MKRITRFLTLENSQVSETEAQWSPGVRYLLADLDERMEKENFQAVSFKS